MAGEVDIGFLVPRDLYLMSRILQPPVNLFFRFLYLIYGDSYPLHPHGNRTHILESLFECVQLLCVRIPYVPALLDSLRHAAMGFYPFFLSIFILKNYRHYTRIYLAYYSDLEISTRKDNTHEHPEAYLIYGPQKQNGGSVPRFVPRKGNGLRNLQCIVERHEQAHGAS